ncbi:MAG TPA: transposase [Candidatus Paceibacterota bacterium]
MRKVQFAPNYIYHVYNRGVEKRDIFLGDADRWRFLQALLLFNREKSPFNLLWKLEHEHRGKMNFRILKEFLEKNSKEETSLVRIMADCLMPNHYHLILEELVEGGITKFMHKLGTGFTMYFNKKYERVGSLFQGPFKVVQVDTDEYLQNLLVYVNVINPAEFIEPNLKEEGVKNIQGIMQFAEAYPWGTQQEYLGIRESPIIDKGVAHSLFPNRAKYEEFVENSLRTRKINTIEHLMLE